MSHRPIEEKKRRRVAKALRRRPLPARIDLIDWLTDRGHARTRRHAREIILASRVKSESHVLGIENTPKGAQVAQYVDAKLRKSITVSG